jgi:parallel beta-helix repeat protein
MKNLNVLVKLLILMTIFSVMNSDILRGDTIIKESMESLILKSDLIIRGYVTQVKPSLRYNAQDFSRVSINVIDNIKGEAAEKSLWIEGCGKKGELPSVFARPKLGDEYVFFLIRKLDNHEVLGAFQGIYGIANEKIVNTNLTLEDFKRHTQNFIKGDNKKANPILKNIYKIQPDKPKTGQIKEEVTYELNGHRWDDSSLPQTIYINPAHALDKNDVPIPFDMIKNAIANSFQRWEDAPYTFHPFNIYQQATNDTMNHLDHRCVISWGSLPANVVATTHTTADDNYTWEVDITFNRNLRWAINDTSGIATTFDIENEATHEIGHFWGLADLYEPYQSELTMYGYTSPGTRKCITLEPGDEEGAMVTNPEFSGIITKDITIPNSQNPVAQVRFEETTIAAGASITLGAFVQVEAHDNITIASEGSLNLYRNALQFWPAKTLTVYGTLNAWQAIFTNDGHSGFGWGGIGIHGNDANSTIIENSNIYHVVTNGGAVLRITNSSPIIKNSHIFMYPLFGTTGIYVGNNASPAILDNVIENNAGDGIHVSNSTGLIARNTIQNNNGAGVRCEFLGSPVLGEAGYYPGTNNEINNNTFGVYASTFSSPYIGSLNNSWYRNNSIHSNSEYNLYVSDYSNALAEYTWWGATDPESKIYYDSTSMAEYQPYLTLPPENNLDSQQTPNQEERNDLLLEAIQYRYDGQYEQSLENLKSIIKNWSNSIEAVQAIVELYHLFNVNGNTEILYFCQSLNPQNEIMSIILNISLMKMMNMQNDLQSALSIADELIQNYPETIYEKEARAEKFYIYLDKYQDYDAAGDILLELKQKYSHDIDVNVMETLLSTEKPTAINDENSSTLHQAALPKEIVLNQNYPNPFNPSTTVEFSIHQSNFVTLKIYNILGEEVATLVSERLAAGKHAFKWDANGLASGMYLYKIQAGDLVQTKKMMLLR